VTNTEVIDNLPTEDRNWIQSTAQNRAELFLPFAKWIGQQWLKGLYASTIHCPTNIYAYINLSKETPVWTMDTAEKIIEAAEWCEFEKNALWHRRSVSFVHCISTSRLISTRLAMSLRDNGYYDAAVPHFRKARELDPSLWVARAGEAQCLYSKATTEAYEAAIGLDTITVNELDNMKPSKTLPLPTIMSNLHLCLERMGHCFLQLGKQEEELEAYRRAFTYENRCDTCLCALFRLYHSMRRHEDVMSLFKNLNEPIPDLDYTRLSESLLREGNYRSAYSFFDSVAIAAFKLHEIPFVAEMYRLAIAEARNQHKPVQATHLSLGLAELYDRYAHDPERAARIWEHVVDTYRSTKADTEIAEAKEAASSCLARTYLKRALDMGKDADESERCGAVLERLAKAKMGTRTSINASEATLTLGIWYKFMGRDDEARACFRVQIKEGIRMLSDDDPDNDWDAYWKLVCVLVAAGDDRNALVMLWKQFDVTCENDSKADEEAAAEQDAKAPDAEEEASEAQVQTDEDAQADPDTPTESTSMTCDGCLRGIAPDYCAICRYCFDVGFCPECFILLKNGTLPVNVCSPKHEWLVIEPRSEAERGAIRPDKLLVDGEQIGLDEWKKRLAKEWGV
jgi:tetratricopeptide (TPR) repeat protein